MNLFSLVEQHITKNEEKVGTLDRRTWFQQRWSLSTFSLADITLVFRELSFAPLIKVTSHDEILGLLLLKFKRLNIIY